jgi:oxygen-independent coproporphyrinogen-3 oxidase
VPAYLASLESGRLPIREEEHIPPATAEAETMLLGLRLVREGVAEERFRARHGRGLDAAFGPTLQELAALGLVEPRPERARLTPRGLELGNQVFARFL